MSAVPDGESWFVRAMAPAMLRCIFDCTHSAARSVAEPVTGIESYGQRGKSSDATVLSAADR